MFVDLPATETRYKRTRIRRTSCAKQLEIHDKYDVCGREIERRFGNGVVQKTRYDKAGRTVSNAQYTQNQIYIGENHNTGQVLHTVSCYFH